MSAKLTAKQREALEFASMAELGIRDCTEARQLARMRPALLKHFRRFDGYYAITDAGRAALQGAK